MPKVRSQIEAERKAREAEADPENETNLNTEDVTTMTTTTTEDTQEIKPANINKLLSAYSQSPYGSADNTSSENILFSEDNLINFDAGIDALMKVCQLLGTANLDVLIKMVVNDSLCGDGNKTALLKAIITDIKDTEIKQQKLVIETKKQQLLSELNSLDSHLARLSVGTIV